MPRKPREEVAGGVFHVYARGNDRRSIFLDHRDAHLYLAMLARVIHRQGWRCLSYCLMPNHIHLLMETPEPNLGAGMQRLHGEYARRFNARHDRSGHVFQGRYGVVRMRNDPQLWAVVRYIALNPVEASLTLRPEQWRWSSHSGIVSDRAPGWLAQDRLFECFGAEHGDARGRYARLVAAT